MRHLRTVRDARRDSDDHGHRRGALGAAGAVLLDGDLRRIGGEMSWDTKRNQLDANLTAIALQARANREGHYVQVRAWEQDRRRERVLWDAVLGATLMLLAWGLWYLAAAIWVP